MYIKFQHKGGGITSVFTQANISYLRKNPDYVELDADGDPIGGLPAEWVTGDEVKKGRKPKKTDGEGNGPVRDN